MAMLFTYPTMNVVVLSSFGQLARGSLAVNHPAAHGNGGGNSVLEEARLAGMAQSVDAPLGQGEVDGPGEVEGSCGWVSEVFGVLVSRMPPTLLH